MSLAFHPRAEQRYLEQTQKDSTPGITSPRFICADCKNKVTTIGRKKTKSGYVCRYCLAED